MSPDILSWSTQNLPGHAFTIGVVWWVVKKAIRDADRDRERSDKRLGQHESRLATLDQNVALLSQAQSVCTATLSRMADKVDRLERRRGR